MLYKSERPTYYTKNEPLGHPQLVILLFIFIKWNTFLIFLSLYCNLNSTLAKVLT